VSVREVVESDESFVIQERWPDSWGTADVDDREPREIQARSFVISERRDDEEWAHAEPLIPAVKRGGRKREANMREVSNGIMYVLSTGYQWRYIPKNLPPRSTVNHSFCLWGWDGTLDRIHDAPSAAHQPSQSASATSPLPFDSVRNAWLARPSSLSTLAVRLELAALSGSRDEESHP
jgi:transposase